MKKIQFFDTTLRDGEQMPGVNFSLEEKIQIAKQLEDWGVDVIEAGFPISSQGAFQTVQAIAETIKKASVTGLARCQQQDIDCAYEALKKACCPQIHLFIATSDIHMAYKLKMSRNEVLKSISEHVAYAKTKFPVVQFSPEDATRTEPAFLVQAVRTAIKAGATVINIPDTVGYTNPKEYGELFCYLKTEIPEFSEVIFSSHCHDDLGMATANALSAIENGATRVEGAINGIGERAGNTALEEVAVALHIRQDHYQCSNNICLVETKKTSDLVSRLSGAVVPGNKAVVGANAYAHESGIHQDGVLKNPDTYEIISPQLVGVATNSLPLGKLSGRHAFITKMEQLGYHWESSEANQYFKQFKQLADKKKMVTEADLHALIAGASADSEQQYQLCSLQVQYSSNGLQGAIISVANSEGEKITDSSVGSGSIQAIYNTLERIFNCSVELLDYRIQAITAGEDAQAEVRVSVLDAVTNQPYHGIGIDFDVLSASAKAYLQALSKIMNQKS